MDLICPLLPNEKAVGDQPAVSHNSHSRMIFPAFIQNTTNVNASYVS